MTLADKRYRSRRVPRFSPSGDDQIGNLSGGGVVASRLLLDWFDMVAIRLENMLTKSGAIIMTHEAGEPEGWLLLNGQRVSERLYPRLAAIYGATDGMVALPDMSDRLAMGAGSLVALNGTSGQSEITLQMAQMPRHSPPVVDHGHIHAADDRGHTHDLHIDSHSHDVSEVVGEEHTHSITDPGHSHAGVLVSAGVVNGSGVDRYNIQGGSTATAQTGITGTNAASTALSLEVRAAEMSGTASAGRADIRVHKSKSGISIGEIGEDAPVNILNPVRGFNFLVKT